MVLRTLFIIISIAVFFQAKCQNRIDLDSLFAGAYKVTGLDSLKWQPQSTTFTYLKNNTILSQSIKSAKEKEVITLQDLSKITQTDYDEFPAHNWENENILLIRTSQEFTRVDIKSKKVLYKAQIDSGAQNITISNRFNIAYTIDSALYIIDSIGNKLTVIDKRQNIAIGQSPYRNEFGTNKGLFWSENGKKLLFYESDETNLTTEYFRDSTDSIIGRIKYPFAGKQLNDVKFGIFSIEDQSTSYINTTKEKGKYITNPAWSSDGNSLYLNILNREQTNIQLKEYDTETGEYVRLVMNESIKNYIEQQQGAILFKTKPEFLWLSFRDGHNHLYHYDIEGLLLSPLTSGNWDITEIIGIDDKEENIFFIGTQEEDPIGRYIYSVNVISLRLKCLSKISGTHKGIIDYTNGNIIDIYSNYTTPLTTVLKDSKGNIIREIHTAKTPFDFVDVPYFDQGTIRADDGKTDLHFHIFKPADFNPEELYPAIIYVYGGPHVQLARNKWLGGIDLLPYLLAQEEFIVFYIDNRGSYGRGIEFEQTTHLKLGQVELQDQLAGLKYLTDLSYIDETRIGIYGWSFGGFMALNMATKAPDKFKTVLAGAPVTNWENYEAMYTERYMGTPESNPEGYKWANLPSQVDKLQSKILIMNGNLDYITVPSQHRNYVKEARKLGKDVSLKTYYGSEHHIIDKERKLFIEDILNFFTDHL